MLRNDRSFPNEAAFYVVEKYAFPEFGIHNLVREGRSKRLGKAGRLEAGSSLSELFNRVKQKIQWLFFRRETLICWM